LKPISNALEHPLSHVDPDMVMHVILARNYRVQRFAEQASDAARRSLESAFSVKSAVSIGCSLVIAACPVPSGVSGGIEALDV
jgi:hypothetical protein